MKTKTFDLYLIAHKVRGQVAFDIATQIKIGNEDGWIIPTSGHRAYPFWSWPLTSLIAYRTLVMPENWPDHYSCNDPQVKASHNRINLDLLLEDE